MNFLGAFILIQFDGYPDEFLTAYQQVLHKSPNNHTPTKTKAAASSSLDSPIPPSSQSVSSSFPTPVITPVLLEGSENGGDEGSEKTDEKVKKSSESHMKRDEEIGMNNPNNPNNPDE